MYCMAPVLLIQLLKPILDLTSNSEYFLYHYGFNTLVYSHLLQNKLKRYVVNVKNNIAHETFLNDFGP